MRQMMEGCFTSPSAWPPLCHPAFGSSSQHGQGNTQSSASKPAGHRPGEAAQFVRRWSTAPPREARGGALESTWDLLHRGQSWGQEVRWQKGRLKMSSENKVSWPGGQVTGARNTGCLSHLHAHQF